MFLFLFCSKNIEQNDTLDKKTFVHIYCDVISKADFLRDQQKEAFVDSVLAHHHVSRKSFENTIQLYNKNSNEWKKVFEKIVEELEKRLQQIDKANKPDTSKTKQIL